MCVHMRVYVIVYLRICLLASGRLRVIHVNVNCVVRA